MGWLSVLVGVAAAVLLYGTGHAILFALAVVSAAGCFWSWGIMHNYATDKAKKRSSYSGGFYDFTGQEILSAPNWITVVNILLTLIAVGLLVIGLVVRLV